MKILVVDDEQLARERVIDMLAKIDNQITVVEADNGRSALEIANNDQPDTVLIDIRMPVMDGLECAFHLAAMPTPPSVIFITAYEKHAVKAFETNAIDYLLKPVREERLTKAIEKAAIINRANLAALQKLRQGKANRSYLSVVSQGKIQLIPVEEIRYFKADQKYVTVYWENGETLIDESLKGLEDEFVETFIRIHRNALVSIAHIVSLEKNRDGGYYIIMKDNQEKLSVSRRLAVEAKQRMKKFSL